MTFFLCALVGMCLFFTPIPMLPFLYFGRLFSERRPKGFWLTIIFMIVNVWMLAVPVWVVLGIYFKSGGEGVAGLIVGLGGTWLYALHARSKDAE